MAKIEKIGNTQVIDNKEDNFFYFPMISMACTGAGYRRYLRAVVADDALPAPRRRPLRSFFAPPLCVAFEPEAFGLLYP